MPNVATALALGLAVLVLPVRAEDPPAEPANAEASEKPSVKDLGDGKYEIGQVKFDRTTRSISFPAEVNMREGPLDRKSQSRCLRPSVRTAPMSTRRIATAQNVTPAQSHLNARSS